VYICFAAWRYWVRGSAQGKTRRASCEWYWRSRRDNGRQHSHLAKKPHMCIVHVIFSGPQVKSDNAKEREEKRREESDERKSSMATATA